MLQQMVRCDGVCDTYEFVYDFIPDTWVKWDGHHYCSPACFTSSVREAGE